MDNATYDGLNLTPVNTDETYYSRLTTFQTKVDPRYEQRRAADIDQSIPKREKQKESKLNMVLITMIMVILLLLTLISIVLSVTTYSQLVSEQSNVLSQLDKTNNDIKSALSQLNATQVAMAQNTSQLLDLVDAQLSILISQQAQYSSPQTQTNCGLGLWY